MNTNTDREQLRERSRQQAQENINRWLGRETHTPLKSNVTVDEIVKRISQAQDLKVENSKNLIPSPHKPQAMADILSSTPARVGVWRAGTRYLTSIMLKLRADHAIAKDAVYAELQPGFAESYGWIPDRKSTRLNSSH